jgi:hypothetical protein
MKELFTKKYFKDNAVFVLFASTFIFGCTLFLMHIRNVIFDKDSANFDQPTAFFYSYLLFNSLIGIIFNLFVLVRNILSGSSSIITGGEFYVKLRKYFLIIIFLNVVTIFYTCASENLNQIVYIILFGITSLSNIVFLVRTIPFCELDGLAKQSHSVDHWVYPYLNDKQLKQLRIVNETNNQFMIALPNIVLSDGGNWLRHYEKEYNLSAFRSYIETKSCKLNDLNKDDFIIISMLGI